MAKTSDTNNKKKTNWVRESTRRVECGADRGDKDAAYELACRLLTGRDIELDTGAGFDWARYAARKGHVRAQELVGFCLAHGIGTLADGRGAVHWFRRAASQGSAVARFNLGCCYLVGIGLPRSVGAARVYFKSAADMGYAKAACALARIGEPRTQAAA